MDTKQALSFLDRANCSNGTHFVNKSYQLDDRENVVPVAIHATVIGLIIVASVVLNSLVLILVARNKTLRYQSIMASLSIVVADLLITGVFHLSSFLSLMTRTWAYSSADSCQAFSILGLYLVYVRWAVLGVVAVDKFCNVRFPFRYSKYSKKILIVLTALAWFVPAVFASLNFFPNDYSFRANVPMCIVACLASERTQFCNVFNTGALSLSIIWGGVLPSILYSWMYYRGYRLKRAVKVLGQLAVNVSAGVVELQPMANTEQSKETRAFCTLVLLFLTNLFTSIPQYVVLWLRPVDLCVFFRIPLIVHFLVTEIFLMSVFLDPIMIMRNKDFRTAFKKTLLVRGKLNNKPAITSVHSNENSLLDNKTPTPV